MAHKTRLWIGIILGFAIVAGGFYLILRPKAILVDLAEVKRGDLVISVGDEGVTRVRDVYLVSAPVSGRMLRINKDVGDKVEVTETILARIEPNDPSFLDRRAHLRAEATVKAAEAGLSLTYADLDRAQAEFDYAARELDRAQELASKGTVSQAYLDKAILAERSARAAVATAEANVGIRQSELENARANLITPAESIRHGRDEGYVCCIDVLSPVKGQILGLLRESEAVVAAGEPLIEVGDPQNMEIVVDLLSTDAVQVVEGAPVLITDWGKDFPLNGRVRRVEPAGFTKISALGVEEQRVNVIIDITDAYERWNTLGHSYRIEAAIEVWRRDNILIVPTSALFRIGEQWAVFVEQDGIAVERPVEIGRQNGFEAAVVDGLKEGEKVIVHPGDRIEDGVRVAGLNDI